MWSIIIQIAFQIIAFVLEKINASQETKKKFFEFVQDAANDTKSTKLAEWGEEQLKELNQMPWIETMEKPTK